MGKLRLLTHVLQEGGEFYVCFYFLCYQDIYIFNNLITHSMDLRS